MTLSGGVASFSMSGGVADTSSGDENMTPLVMPLAILFACAVLALPHLAAAQRTTETPPVITTPEWREALTTAGQDNAAGLVPTSRLGVGQLDGPVDLSDFRFNESASGRVAQAAGAPGGERTALPASPEAEGLSASELNRQSLWSLEFQFNNYRLANDRWNNQLQLQPVLPVGPHQRPEPHHAAGDPPLQHRPARDGFRAVRDLRRLGDMILPTMLSPANAGPWILGAGPMLS